MPAPAVLCRSGEMTGGPPRRILTGRLPGSPISQKSGIGALFQMKIYEKHKLRHKKRKNVHHFAEGFFAAYQELNMEGEYVGKKSVGII
jgi:hypothetical protein